MEAMSAEEKNSNFRAAMESMSGEEKTAATLEIFRATMAQREKVEKRFRSLPEEKKKAILKKRLEEWRKKDRLREWEKRELLPNEKYISIEGVIGSKEYFPFGSPISPSECSEYMKKDEFMEFCKLAIESYNIEHHSNFEPVAVEDLHTYGLSIMHHEMTFTARDAKDPNAARLTFEADVTRNIHDEKKVLYCKCKE